MPDIYIAKRVVDYLGLGARGIPEHATYLTDKMQPTLALLQAMGADGAKLLNSDQSGNLITTQQQIDPWQSTYEFNGSRPNFDFWVSDLGGLYGGNRGVVDQFSLASVDLATRRWLFNPTASNGGEVKTSIQAYGLPWAQMSLMLPAQAALSGAQGVQFGVEASGGAEPGPFFSFNLAPADFQVRYKLVDAAGVVSVSIAGSLPGTYNTATHRYVIVGSEDAVRWLIDGAVVFTLSLAAMQVSVTNSWLGFIQGFGAGVNVTVAVAGFSFGAAISGRRIAANFPSVSGANAAQQVVMDLRDTQNMLDILSAASGGTATLQVEVSTDNANWTSIDTLAAALTQAKHYLSSTVGATVALCPLAFRFVRITAGAAGAGFTTTLTVSAK